MINRSIPRQQLLIVTLFLGSFFFSMSASVEAKPIEAASRDSRADSLWAELRTFLQYSSEAARSENVLPPAPTVEIGRLQEWTRENQGYMAKQANSGPLVILWYRYWKKSEKMQLQELLVLYEAYAKKSSKLFDEVFFHFPFHLNEISDLEYSKIYYQRFLNTLAAMLPPAGSRFQASQPFDCDYLNQPTNALYFSLSAARYVDEIGRFHFGDEWISATGHLHQGRAELKTPLKLSTELKAKIQIPYPGN